MEHYEPLPRRGSRAGQCCRRPAVAAAAAGAPRSPSFRPPPPTFVPRSTAEDGEAGLGGSSSPEPPHLALLGSEAWTWEGVANLDQFFTRIYRRAGGTDCCV